MKSKEREKISTSNFAVMILTHGRAGRVITISTLRKHGYTGRVILVIDDEDEEIEAYQEEYEEVVIFSKKEEGKLTDGRNNFGGLRSVVYARNASQRIAKDLGLKWIWVLDDDYGGFDWRFVDGPVMKHTYISDLDSVVTAYVDFLEDTGADTVAMLQTGDLMGGVESRILQRGLLLRKAMNSFFISMERFVEYYGDMNDDVSAYVDNGSRGRLYLTPPFCCLQQKTTQANPGGLTSMYLAMGTYQKSFYSVLSMPSAVTINEFPNSSSPRLHHRIDWNATVPKILSESHKKS